MEENFEQILEKQIGDLGGDQEVIETPELGKLQHIPGQQDKLSSEEESSLEKFKQATSTIHNSRIMMDNDINKGWVPIDRSSMGFRSQFYPEDWEFRVRPATVEAIKNWSAIDEENMYVVNNVMNEIIRTCVSIYSEITGRISWDKINSWDRFWFILKVREYTFMNGEQALEFDEECDNCGANLHYVLNSDSLYYEFPDTDVVEKHWDQNKMCWNINPADYDLPHKHPVKLYIPTLQKDQAIIQWVYAQSEAHKNIDEVFIKFLPFMLERAPKDSNLLDKFIKECYREYKSWDTEMFMFMDDVRRNIIINPDEKLAQKCPECGEEVHSTVQFPNGIKYLFAIQSKHRKFGSK